MAFISLVSLCNFHHTNESYKHVFYVLITLSVTHLLSNIIIHSKYFPDSDWLKAHV